jgi:hypothetical protein
MEILQQVKTIAEEIRNLTQGVSFSKDEETLEKETEAYATMIEAREPLVEKLGVLRPKIGPKLVETPEFAEIRRILADIRKMDMAHMDSVKSMRDFVQDSYKHVKQGQKVYAGYHAHDENSSARLFDRRQ